MENYIKELNRLEKIEQLNYDQTANEKSEHYIIEFKRAKSAIELFAEGKEEGCIKDFFGAYEESHKEVLYLIQSFNFYNQWKKDFGEEKLQV